MATLVADHTIRHGRMPTLRPQWQTSKAHFHHLKTVLPTLADLCTGKFIQPAKASRIGQLPSLACFYLASLLVFHEKNFYIAQLFSRYAPSLLIYSLAEDH